MMGTKNGIGGGDGFGGFGGFGTDVETGHALSLRGQQQPSFQPKPLDKNGFKISAKSRFINNHFLKIDHNKKNLLHFWMKQV